MKKTSILQRFYGREKSCTVIESIEKIDMALKYHADVLKKYIGGRFPGALKRTNDALKYLSQETIESNEVIYRDFKEMIQGLVNRIFEYIENHPDEKEINHTIDMYRSEELIGLKYQLGIINLKLRRATNQLSDIFEEQNICVNNLKRACLRAKEIRHGAEKNVRR